MKKIKINDFKVTETIRIEETKTHIDLDATKDDLKDTLKKTRKKFGFGLHSRNGYCRKRQFDTRGV